MEYVNNYIDNRPGGAEYEKAKLEFEENANIQELDKILEPIQ